MTIGGVEARVFGGRVAERGDLRARQLPKRIPEPGRLHLGPVLMVDTELPVDISRVMAWVNVRLTAGLSSGRR